MNKGEGWVRQLLAVSDLPIVKKINQSFLKYEWDNNVSPNPTKSSNFPESNVVTPTRVILYNESSASSSQVWVTQFFFPFYKNVFFDRQYTIIIAFKKDELNKTNKNRSRAFSRSFTRVKFVWIPTSSMLPQRCYHVTELSCSLITKGFKGFYCPLRHIRTPVTTTTDAHCEKKWLMLFSTSFFMHTTQSISCLKHSTDYVTTSQQLWNASKILKSEASISLVKQEK